MSYYETERDNKIIAALENIAKQLERMNEPICEVAKVPTADVEEVKHGEWIIDGDITECSNCHKEYITARGMLQLKEFDYCPHCGAKMDGGKKE